MNRVKSLLLVLLVLVGAYCGGKRNEVKPIAVVDLPAEAIEPLTDEAIAICVKALPGVGAALRSAGFAPPEPAADAQIAQVITGFVDAMGAVEGVNAALQAAGTDWPSFRSTMLKIAAAQAATSAEMFKGMLPEMKKDTATETKKAVAQVEALIAACDKVPAVNREMVQKHAKALEALRELAKEPEGTSVQRP